MCALCGALLSEHWAEQDGGRRGRSQRVRLLNRVLVHFGLELGDWSGRVYVLRDRKGRSAVVADLATLWWEAELLAGRRLDPLDPVLLASLAHGS
jgi:autotransporter translocation and assembly factor TamB